jgi:hypothetical protein
MSSSYALADRLNLNGHPGRSRVLAAMEGRVLAKGLLMGTYERAKSAWSRSVPLALDRIGGGPRRPSFSAGGGLLLDA